ncbi:MAG: hypothetical protein IJP90_11095 [Treponema sp.]|nr:hypothetical protein [Treponema sp.]MBR0100242.1 hypothetical protein [Treponema sp.]
MKMFKRITATLVLVFSLCSIAWGESKYEKAVKYIQNNIKSLEIVGENEKTYDRLFHEENKLKTDDKLWCYTGKSDEKILLGHIPGNKDMEVGKNFEV